MSVVHVYPAWEAHDTHGFLCICEPECIPVGTDDAGKSAVVVSHRRRDN